MKTANDMIEEKGGDILCVPEGTTVLEALEQMNARKVGAILVTVTVNRRVSGQSGTSCEICLMRPSIPKRPGSKTVMTKNLIFAPHTDTVYNLMDKFLGLRVRHLLIEKNGETIGMVSGGDVMKASIQEKDGELKQLNSMVGWDYYENWCWRPESK